MSDFVDKDMSALDARLGWRIRALRREAGLTLDGLARLSEVSRAMLSRVERGESSPTAQLLVRICGGLGATLSALFDEAGTAASVLARRADQPVWRDPATGYVRRAVSPPDRGRGVEIVDVALPPGATVALDSRRFPGRDQHVWVLDGTLEIGLGDDTVGLEAGDCLVMGFDRPIRFHNPSARPARYAVIVNREGKP